MISINHIKNLDLLPIKNRKPPSICYLYRFLLLTQPLNIQTLTQSQFIRIYFTPNFIDIYYVLLLYLLSIQQFIFFMINQFKRTLSKQIYRLQSSLPQKQNFQPENLVALLSELQLNLESSLVTIAQDTDKKLADSKNSLKKSTKAFNDYKILSEKKLLETTKENEKLQKEVERSKNKVNELLKKCQKYEKNHGLRDEIISFEKGTQCNMRDMETERILNEREKQNISLKQRISELQNQLNESKQDVEAANILIKELIRQLQTNIADRETWYGTGSSNSSDLNSLDRLDNFEQSQSDSQQIPGEIEQQVSEVSVCRGGTGQDCSTIDGSNTTNKDYALPEWLEFGQQTSKQKYLPQSEQEETKMWPELLWNRLRQLMGKSYEL